MAAQENIENWQDRSACRGPLGAVFFPPPQTERKREKLAREARAKNICFDCPVLSECRSYALAIREPHGVWGGLSETERRVMLAS